MKPPAGTLIKPGHPDTQGMIANWPFNAGFGSKIYDYASVKNWDARNHGTINGATWISSERGPVLSLNGSSDYIDCGSDNSLNLVSALTLLSWVKTSSQSTLAGRVMSRRSGTPGYEYYIFQTSGDLAFVSGGLEKAIVTSSGLLDGQWHLIVYTYDGDKVIAYIDGIERASSTGVTITSDPGTTMFIGDNGVHTRQYNGLIDSPRIWNRALSADEVRRIYFNSYSMFNRQISPAVFPVPVAVIPIPIVLNLFNQART